jgi:serine/threonine-protein kinase RsbT
MITKTDQQIFKILTPSDIAHVLIAVKNLAAEIKFSDPEQSLIATAASELATNIVRYAGKGTITIEILSKGRILGISINAEDEGPGITDIEKALSPEYSTGNSLGLGLSSVQRIMDIFEINSELGRGTTVQTVKWRTF